MHEINPGYQRVLRPQMIKLRKYLFLKITFKCLILKDIYIYIYCEPPLTCEVHMNNGNQLRRFLWNVGWKGRNTFWCLSHLLLGGVLFHTDAPAASRCILPSLLFPPTGLTSSKARVSGELAHLWPPFPSHAAPLLRVSLVTIDWLWHWTGHEGLAGVWRQHVSTCACVRLSHSDRYAPCRLFASRARHFAADLFVQPLRQRGSHFN